METLDTGAAAVEFTDVVFVNAKSVAAASFAIDSLSNGDCSELCDATSDDSPTSVAQIGLTLPSVVENSNS